MIQALGATFRDIKRLCGKIYRFLPVKVTVTKLLFTVGNDTG